MKLLFNKIIKYLSCAALLSGSLASCSLLDSLISEKKEPLLGERIEVFNQSKPLKPELIVNPNTLIVAEESSSYSDNPDNSAFQVTGNLKFAWPHGDNNITLREVMKFNIRENFKFPLSSLPIIVKNNLIVLETTGIIKKFDINSGKLIWQKKCFTKIKKQLLGSRYLNGGVLINDDIIFISLGTEQLIALSIIDGKELWSTNLSSVIRSVPTIIGNKIIVQGLNNTTYALNHQNGKVIWTHLGIIDHQVKSLFSSHPVKIDQDSLIVQDSYGNITAINANNGQEIWSLKNDMLTNIPKTEEIIISYYPIFDKSTGTIFAVNPQAQLFAIEVKSGKLLWKKENTNIRKPFWLAGELLYVINGNEQIAAIDKNNGKIYWTNELQDKNQDKSKSSFLFGKSQHLPIVSSPTLINNNLVVTRSDNTLLVFDCLNGKQLYKVKVRKNTELPVIVDQDHIYITSNDGAITKYSLSK